MVSGCGHNHGDPASHFPAELPGAEEGAEAFEDADRRNNHGECLIMKDVPLLHHVKHVVLWTVLNGCSSLRDVLSLRSLLLLSGVLFLIFVFENA